MTTATQGTISERGAYGSTHERRGRPLDDSERIAKALGWFGVGLGLAQLASPRGVTRLIGVRDSEENRRTMQLFGIRELTSGLGILGKKRPVTWVWARLAGDALDLALLGKSLGSRDSNKNRVAAATAAVVGVTLLDYLTGQHLSRESNGNPAAERTSHRQGQAITVRKAITVQRPREEVYRFWSDFSNLPRFMEHLESVQLLDDRRSHWKAKAPAGSSVEWDAEITEERENEFIAWRSLQDADVDNWGSVQFVDAPGDRGTEVHVKLRYEPPGGKLASIVAKLFGEEPGQQVESDLRRFKQVMEVGEVVLSDASIHRRPHPGRPPEPRRGRVEVEGGVR